MRWTFWEDRERERGGGGMGRSFDESDYLGLFG